MKKIQFLLLMVAVAIMPAVMASCEKDEPTNVNPPSNTDPEPDEPEEDQFEDLYGYWINSDNTGAMEFTKSGSNCNVRYYAHTTDGLESYLSTLHYWGSINSTFTAYTTEGDDISVRIVSNSKNRIVLEKYSGWGNLSSYSFSRVTEKAFYDFLEGGQDEPNDPEESDDAAKLIGTWVGYDGTPGLEWTDKYTITFYSSGKAKEVCSFGGGGTESSSGTYKYSNGKITEWEMEDGSVLVNALGDPSDSPWSVTFITPTEITIGDKYSSITFNKQ